jgi:hypothetical protein
MRSLVSSHEKMGLQYGGMVVLYMVVHKYVQVQYCSTPLWTEDFFNPRTIYTRKILLLNEKNRYIMNHERLLTSNNENIAPKNVQYSEHELSRNICKIHIGVRTVVIGLVPAGCLFLTV